MAWTPVFFLLLLVPLGAQAAPGGTLFEQVALGAGATTVPFPLDALLARIAGQLATGRDGLRVVLIPIGRSLQRHAAGDAHAFALPRAVIAVTGEPSDARAPLLKDRLYLGYSPAAGLLEVISYHPGSGRFEFQIVDDYRAGATPRLRPGNRGLCLACHQNHAPIFSRPGWDETSANPVIARLLARTGRDFDGLPWRHGVDVPQAIDAATERANLLPVAQRVWRQGCADADPSAAIACRRALFQRALLARLRGVPDTEALARDPALAPLRRHWRHDWAEGLPIPDPDIPDRRLFAADSPGAPVATDPATLHHLADVAAPFDPLALRPPREHWALSAPDTPARLFHALGQFISATDVRSLDAALRTRPGATDRQRLSCQRTPRGARINLDCRAGARLHLQARLSGPRLAIDRLVLDGRATPPVTVQATDAGFAPIGQRPRRADGHALSRLRLDAGAEAAEFTDDLAPLEAALDALADDARAGRSDAFADAPLRRANLIGPLLSALGRPAPAPVAATEPVTRAHTGHRARPPALAPFYRRCAMCHTGSEAFPPAFLRGDDATVTRQLTACAPRMLRRLAMWQRPAGAREKVPMPPPAAPPAQDLRACGDLDALRTWLNARLAPDARTALDRLAYADLPACTVDPESSHGR
ncbi:hypothetical protein G3580_17295 [Nitrogeniibacter mangrovi]|uniref:Cytochrome c domain-containing protein n=1 Tax=Nitrogeniibacter mangrovi TaxID=2016596 RepID=A0A6C1B8Z8_9RHOO|nr:hypothetical protein [Nitrogeniibacter mangrovi]QID19218.1 hypothetical protein G3580_17295 [Nitrogeniibacter mangrovi]